MRIVPYSSDEELEDIPTITIIIKAIPFEDSYVPACVINTPEEDYIINIEELSSLMDGIEIVSKQVDQMINYLITPKSVSGDDIVFTAEIYDQDDEDDEEDEY